VGFWLGSMAGEDLQLDEERVLQRMMQDGTLDALRRRAMQELEASGALRALVDQALQGSEQLQKGKQSGWKVDHTFSQVLKEVDESIMRQISDQVWQLLSQDQPLGEEVRESVDRALVDEIRARHGLAK